MYILLTSARKNVGDFLIRDRSIKLLKYYKPHERFKELNSWEPLENHLAVLNSSKGIIICGGPGYSPYIYPYIYPLVKDLNSVKVPIYILGGGWFGSSADDTILNNYKFTTESRQLLDKVAGNNGLSVRDTLSQKVLNQNGYNNTILTGCPVLYNIKHLGTNFTPPSKISKIVFTTPQNSIYYDQSIAIIKLIKILFPSASLYCSFHRGINSDKYTSERESRGLTYIKEEAERLGYQIIDAAYDLKKIDFYSSCDLHIGYRVHAHLYFISEHKPTFLLHEDGRGNGFTELLSFGGVDAYQINSLTRIINMDDNFRLPKDKIIKTAKPTSQISQELSNLIEGEFNSNFHNTSTIFTKVDYYHNSMRDFIYSIE